MNFKRPAPFLIVAFWIACAGVGRGGEIAWIPPQATWRFMEGRTEATLPDPGAWRGLGFDDRAWVERPAVFFYGESGFAGTQLAEMRGEYSSFFLRKTFVVSIRSR